jgi:hypothetical protein
MQEVARRPTNYRIQATWVFFERNRNENNRIKTKYFCRRGGKSASGLSTFHCFVYSRTFLVSVFEEYFILKEKKRNLKKQVQDGNMGVHFTRRNQYFLCFSGFVQFLLPIYVPRYDTRLVFTVRIFCWIIHKTYRFFSL